MNKIFLIGNITHDPELSETDGGTARCKFSLAVNRAYAGNNGERQTDFFACVAWRNQAEAIARYCKKGSKISIVGTVQVRQYEDSQGVKRTAFDVVIQEQEFLSKASETAEEENNVPKATNQRKKPTLKPVDDDEEPPF